MTNDEKILKLKSLIEDKKKVLEKSKFNPKTNCSLELSGVRYNLHAVNTAQAKLLIINIHMLKKTAEELNLGDVPLSGYTINEWYEDLQSKLANLRIGEEEKKLKSLEQTLKNLLSNDKKIELEIADIEKQLK